MEVLQGLFYSKDHEWVKVEGDKAYIGITDYAQNALGDIVYIELPEVEEEIEVEDTFGVVESVKAASDLFMPISGKVIEVNEELEDDPAFVNTNPYDSWIVCVEATETEELDELMDAEDYKKYCSKEA